MQPKPNSSTASEQQRHFAERMRLHRPASQQSMDVIAVVHGDSPATSASAAILRLTQGSHHQIIAVRFKACCRGVYVLLSGSPGAVLNDEWKVRGRLMRQSEGYGAQVSIPADRLQGSEPSPPARS